MDKKKALQKLRSAKREALRNSSCIQVGRLDVTDLMSCHGFAHMNCHQIDWFSVISQPHRAAA